MITIRQQGDFHRLNGFFERCLNLFKMGELDKYGQAGVEALASTTPVDSGKTASSWSYEIKRDKNGASIIFKNSNMTDMNVPVAILLQYGHATRDGGYVEGIDYINPALRPVFQRMADEAWREVSS
jgi:hypothetical protein